MSYSSKRMIANMSVGIVLLVVYAVYAFSEVAPAPENLQAWAIALLGYIGSCIVAGIAIQIIVQIALAIGIAVKEKDCNDNKVERIIKSSMIEDEREKLITLKSSSVSYKCAGFGFVLGLILLATGVPAVIVLHCMAGSFALGSIVEGCMNVYLNEKGVRNG